MNGSRTRNPDEVSLVSRDPQGIRRNQLSEEVSGPLSPPRLRRITCMTDVGVAAHMGDHDREERRRKIDEALAYIEAHDAELLKRLEDA